LPKLGAVFQMPFWARSAVFDDDDDDDESFPASVGGGNGAVEVAGVKAFAGSVVCAKRQIARVISMVDNVPSL